MTRPPRLPLLPVRPSCTGDDLDGLTIATPCDVPWESLAGDDRVRHCGRCRQNVYNVEALSRAEALRLIESRDRLPCLRLHRRPDGTLVTSDCWSRLRAARRRGWGALAAAVVVVLWAELWAVLFGLRGLGRVVMAAADGRTPAAESLEPPREATPPPPTVAPPPFMMGAPPAPPPPERLLGKIRAPRRPAR